MTAFYLLLAACFRENEINNERKESVNEYQISQNPLFPCHPGYGNGCLFGTGSSVASYRYPFAHGHGNRHPHGNGYLDPHSHADTDAIADLNPDTYAHNGADHHPTPQPVMTTIFTDTFDDDSQMWDLSKGITIKNGKMILTSYPQDGNTILIPLEKHRQADVIVKADLQIANWNKKPDMFFGIACRANEVTFDQYLLYVSPLSENQLAGAILKIKAGAADPEVSEIGWIDLEESVLDKAVALQFICQGSDLSILADNQVIVQASGPEFESGSLVLWVSTTSYYETVEIDNLEVIRIDIPERSAGMKQSKALKGTEGKKLVQAQRWKGSETYNAPRAYEIANRFRGEKGKPVIVGGYHPTFMPDQA